MNPKSKIENLPLSAAQGPKSEILVIGVGNEYCHDDGVGLVVARRVRASAPRGVRVLEESGEGAALLDAWTGADTVILCDAAHSGAPAGTLLRLEPFEQPIPAGLFRFSTHNFGVAEAVELGRALGQVPARLVIYGIEGADYEPGVGLSPAVARAADAVVRAIRAELGAPASITQEVSYA